jgi:uncharacterized protein YjbI with pentapeptide repeats
LLIVVSACILRLPAWLVARDTSVHELKADQLASAVNGARSALVQGLVGLLALTGIVVAWQQLSADRERSRNDREQFSEQLSLTREQLSLTRQAQVAEQLTGALEQLASQTLEVRLGGIYGLERIAKESGDNDLRLVVTEVLAAYVRQHAPVGPKATAAAGRSMAKFRTPAPDVKAAMTVLARRTVLVTDPPLDLSNVALGGMDLHDIQLQGANLTGAELQEANLERANLQGAVLKRAELQKATFTDARLQGANLEDAQLQEAHLSIVNLQNANLARASLQRADFFTSNECT